MSINILWEKQTNKQGGVGKQKQNLKVCKRFGMQNWVKNLSNICPKFAIKVTVWVVKKHSISV